MRNCPLLLGPNIGNSSYSVGAGKARRGDKFSARNRILFVAAREPFYWKVALSTELDSISFARVCLRDFRIERFSDIAVSAQRMKGI